MQVTAASEFVCPITRQPLRPAPGGDFLEAPDGRRYAVRDGIPELVAGDRGSAAAAQSQQYYREKAREYDQGIEVMFQTFGADEAVMRDNLIGALALDRRSRVLETGCGTCRDTVYLAARAGVVYATDIAREMIEIGRARLAGAGVPADRARLFVCDATALPFPDAFFDAAYHFGGINVFPDVARGIAEMSRVVRPGGRVVFGDEGVAPWLKEREFGRILVDSNPLYRHQPPLAQIPASARDVSCRWILNGAFYVIEFTVGQGEPFLDVDVEFPGWRGGSHRTRYFGKLEGVAPELKQQVVAAAAGEGISIAAWLERALKSALKK